MPTTSTTKEEKRDMNRVALRAMANRAGVLWSRYVGVLILAQVVDRAGCAADSGLLATATTTPRP